MEIGRLNALITADDRDFTRKMDGADRKGASTAGRIRSTFANLKLTIPAPRFDPRAAQEAAAGAGRAMTIGLTAPITLLGGAAVKSAVEMESLRLALETTTGSAGEAARQFKDLEQVAKLPGLGLKQVVEGSVALQASGFAAKDAERQMKAYGNALVSVGRGKTEFAEINRALVQLANSTQPLAEDINQIRDRLPQFQKLMIQAFGSARSEDIQKLGITGRQFVERMVVELEKLPKAAGGSRNTFDNLSDAAEQSAAKIGAAVLRVAVPALEKLTPKIEEAAAAFERLSPEAQNAALGVTAVALAAGPTLSAVANLTIAVSGLTSGARALQGALAALSIGRLAAVGAGLTTVGVTVATLSQDGSSPYTTKLRKEADERAQAARIGQQAASGQLGAEAPDEYTARLTRNVRGVMPKPIAAGFTMPRIPKGTGGGGSSRAAEITEAGRLTKQLTELNQEIAYLGNVSSKEYKLRFKLDSALEVKAELEKVIELRRNLFDDDSGKMSSRLEALQEYNRLSKTLGDVQLTSVLPENFLKGMEEGQEAFKLLRESIEGSVPVVELTNEQALAVGKLGEAYKKLNSIEQGIILTEAQNADAKIKTAKATEYLESVSKSLGDEMEGLMQSTSVYLNTFRDLSLKGFDMASEGVQNVLKAAQGVDAERRGQSEQERIADETQSFEQRMRDIGGRLGQDFDDLIGAIFAGGDKWKSALASLAKDFFNSLAQEFMRAATGGKHGSLGSLLGGIASSAIKGLLGGFGGGFAAGAPTTILSGMTPVPAGFLADGGMVSGPGTSTSDSIPLWGSNGEFMVNARAVRHYGRDFLERVNDRRLHLPAFATGGYVGRETARPVLYRAEGGMISRERSHASTHTTGREPAPIAAAPVTVIQNFQIAAPAGTVPQRTQQQIATRAAEGAQLALRRNG